MSNKNSVFFYEHHDFGRIATNYFEGLFSTDCFENIIHINYIRSCISDEDNQSLLAPFSMTKFKASLFQMHSDKFPDPDGLNVAFFKNFRLARKWFLPTRIK